MPTPLIGLLQTPLTCLLLLWPVVRLYRRVGLHPGWAVGLFASIFFPFAGYVAVLLPLLLRPWPLLPPAAKSQKPIKTPI